MPELPEVEVTRRGIAQSLDGACIAGVRLGKPLRWLLGCAPETLVGQRVRGVTRRGKYVLLALDHGVLLLHLGMSGSVRCTDTLPAPGPHDHFDLLTDRACLRLNDPRRFGAVVYASGGLDSPRARKLLDALGPEPLEPDFTPAVLRQGLSGHRASIKQVLLAGQAVVGVGNIYACEALFLAGIRPTTAAAALGSQRVQRLHAAIVQVLRQALDSGGSTLRNFAGTGGDVGRYQQRVLVYARAGAPCVRCSTPIRMIRQGQRSTYFCPHCQKP
ncbi:MAG: bifunctional DNA-formamidopyrimidine glycosylase/DNA-(apurinic or apyrimidinic site) lyase [Rhodoferax sp.]